VLSKAGQVQCRQVRGGSNQSRRHETSAESL
jgi:hypothetical protein